MLLLEGFGQNVGGDSFHMSLGAMCLWYVQFADPSREIKANARKHRQMCRHFLSLRKARKFGLCWFLVSVGSVLCLPAGAGFYVFCKCTCI